MIVRGRRKQCQLNNKESRMTRRATSSMQDRNTRPLIKINCRAQLLPGPLASRTSDIAGIRESLMRLLFGKLSPNFGKRCSMSKSTFGGGNCQAPLSLNPLTRYLLLAYASHHATHVLAAVQTQPLHAEMSVRDLGLTKSGMGRKRSYSCIVYCKVQGPDVLVRLVKPHR